MSSFGVNELTQLGAYECTVGGKATLQNGTFFDFIIMNIPMQPPPRKISWLRNIFW